MFEKISKYGSMIDFFVRNRDEWFDVKSIAKNMNIDRKKAYFGVHFLFDLDIIRSKKLPSDKRAFYYTLNTDSDIGSSVLLLYSKLAERF